MRAVNNHNSEVCYIGGMVDLGFKYKHIGTDRNSLFNILDESHPMTKKLKTAKNPVLIVGTRAVEEFGSEVLDISKQIALKFNITTDTYNGFNVLHKDSVRPGALDLGVVKSDIDIKSKKILYILNADNIDYSLIPKDTFIIYQGTTGDVGASYADLILPTASCFEKTGTYVNTEGRVQLARKAVSAPNLAKPDWEIIRILGEELKVDLPYDSLEDIRYRIAEVAPHLLVYDIVEKSKFGKLSLQSSLNNKVKTKDNYILADLIDDYYKTDSISRNSLIMSKCSAAFNSHKFRNFKKITN